MSRSLESGASVPNWPTSSAAAADGSLEASHRKRLAMILRYIATMHHSADAQKGISFIHDGQEQQHRHEDILFTTSDFRHVMAMDTDGTLFSSAPFSFYAASTGGSPTANAAASRKRTIAGAIKDTLLSKPRANDGRPCWLRLTRIAAEFPPRVTQVIKQYLRSWKQSVGDNTSISDLLTLDRLANAPNVAPGRQANEIKTFLRQYKRFIKRKRMRTSLEPLYNRLFEWLQEQGTQELVWGFGSARMRLDDGSYIQGPMLEVLVEVELAMDGALLVRPRPHTGVALNREVTSALTASGDAGHDVLSNLHRTVADLETYQISPGQPSSYASLLKRAAVELSPGGRFISSASAGGMPQDRSRLTVTDAWILFHRPKPSTVWARDASVLAETVLGQETALPLAAWSLTHGPAVLQSMVPSLNNGGSKGSILSSFKSVLFGTASADATSSASDRPLLPLPSSEAQNRIADLLMTRNAPAIVCEGPPGTGKSHTIANMVCAYLCQGKRVLVTSKGAPALSVLRERLPKCVQELCVDVSLSESTGMRQLQQTVERLADRVSCISTEVQEEQCELLKRNIQQLEKERQVIDEKLKQHSEQKRKVVQSADGQELIDLAISLVDTAPWMMRTASSWTVADANKLVQRVEGLQVKTKDPYDRVTGFPSPPSKALVSLVASKSGETMSYVKTAAAQAFASVPLLGNTTKTVQEEAQRAIGEIRLEGAAPQNASDWNVVLLALQHDVAMHEFHGQVVEALVARDGWLEVEIYDQSAERKRLQSSFVDNLKKIARLKELCWKKNISGEVEQAVAARHLDARRTKITLTLQRLAEDLVDATVITSLSRMFTPEAQSALIRFAQISGKSKFSRSSQASKMSQRQQRHRQEYLDAFEKCVRYIPCWILTSSQISDYLPAEFGLFDLVVIDEASQSDVTALPGILRGKQWLIVGDGKQVSPGECFISEAQIDSLRAVLPESPLEDSLLPGQSFFDLCAQAFPSGRVVLSEHFRCAPEIIGFSNEQFYNGRLIPLRLPTSSERLQPSIIDVRVRNGAKVGKINEKECDTIVELVRDFVVKTASDPFPRSIGVISLVGDEQSRLIRGRLLDAISPQKYKEHDVLVGDAPTFQGAERDIIFLSMVCSPGAVPTQSQLMHAQRANVALSRARDRMVLVRSIDANHIPSQDDIKLPILEFFARHGKKQDQSEETPQRPNAKRAGGIVDFRGQAESLLEDMLRNRGYAVRRMGVVWHDAICVENVTSGRRAAVCVDGAGETSEQWARLVTQQKSIERVGWESIRVDALSFLSDHASALQIVEGFLQDAGVAPVKNDQDDMVYDELESDNGENAEEIEVDSESENEEENAEVADVDDADIVVISSDDESETTGRKPKVAARVEVKTEPEDDSMDPAAFGDVVDLDFLKGSSADTDNEENVEDPYDHGSGRKLRFQRRESDGDCDAIDVESQDSDDDNDNDGNGVARLPSRRRRRDDDDDYVAEDESDESQDGNDRPTKRQRGTRSRIDKYARDPLWYPGRNRRLYDDDHEKEWYDADSDLEEKRRKPSKSREESKGEGGDVNAAAGADDDEEEDNERPTKEAVMEMDAENDGHEDL